MNPVNRQLLLVKYLYQRGDDTLADKGMFSAGLAISLFQDAAELLIWTAAKEFDAQVSDNDGFLKVWDAVKTGKKNIALREPPLKAKILELNKARVGFKHYGIVPSFEDAAKFQAYAEQFLVAAFNELFAVDFDAISLVDLIENQQVAELLRVAETSFAKNDIKTTLEMCAKANYYLSQPLEALVPPVEEKLSSAVGKIGEPFARDLQSGVKEMEESFRALRHLALITSLGISLADFLRYRSVTPHVWEMSPGQFNVIWDFVERRITLDDAEFALRHIINFAITLQSSLRGMTFTDRDYFFRTKSLGRRY